MARSSAAHLQRAPRPILLELFAELERGSSINKTGCRMESSSKPVAPDEPPKIDAMPELLETQSAHMQLIRTERLEIAFEEGGAEHSEIALLLHGWPDDPRTW